MIQTQVSQTDPRELSRCSSFDRLTVAGQDRYSEDIKADAALAQKVDRALWKDDVLRAIDYHEIDVVVMNGIVYLNGHIDGTTSQSRIENALRKLPGMLGLKNNLVLDDMLTFEVASALAGLEHTYACKFFTGVSHGVVSLHGDVNDEKVKLLAEECVAANPRVRGVINSVRVQGTDPEIKDQPFLQPSIGEEILFLDGVSSVVRQVIIAPNNRRVLAMLLWGRFADQKQELRSMNNNETRPPEKLAVISMDQVRYLTKFSGFLTIRSNERNRYMDFDPASFHAPHADWVPPYPYCSEDVLFPVDLHQPAAPLANIPNQILTPVVVGEQLTKELLANDSLGG
ncbi:MAG TPA: BON domain-containing protein [Anaerolineales bacterium]